MTQLSNAQLADALQQVIVKVDAREDQLILWQSGDALGGPQGDGRYAVTDLLGNETLIKSPARLAYEVDQLVTGATGAAAQAEAAKTAAEAAQASASGSATTATNAATTATAQAAQADTFRSEAANSEANALAHRNAVEALAVAFASTSAVPSTPSSPGTAGEFVFDTHFIYVCVADNTWKRAALSLW